MFPAELEQNAFRSGNEFAWTRAQFPLVVKILRAYSLAILGGELWWVREGVDGYSGIIPQKQSPPAVYGWTTDCKKGESWSQFVERGIFDALSALGRWPAPEDLPTGLPGRILYNLTWVSQSEFEKL